MTRRLIVEPRGLAPWWLKLLIPIGSVVAAMIVGALFLAITGNDWVEVYQKMADAAFGSGRGVAETLVSATPLILTGVAAAIAFKMLVWNIGGEGQLIFGAITAAGVGIWLSGSTPPFIAITAVVLAGAVGGAFWASLSAVPKVYLGTNEIITTLMLNFIALNFMNYLVLGSFSPWRDPEATQFPQGRPIIENGRDPRVLPPARLGSLHRHRRCHHRVVRDQQDAQRFRVPDRRGLVRCRALRGDQGSEEGARDIPRLRRRRRACRLDSGGRHPWEDGPAVARPRDWASPALLLQRSHG